MRGAKILKIAAMSMGFIALIIGAFLTKVAIIGIPKYKPNPPTLHVELTQERIDRGAKFARILCTQCHFDPQTQKLTGAVMHDAPKEFGLIVSKNITQDPEKGIGAWSDGELAYFLRTGIARTGQYVPPYMIKLPHISDEDLYSIIAFLRSDDPLVQAENVDPPGVTQPSFLTKLLSSTVFGPLPYPEQAIVAPSPRDHVAYGRYLVTALDCAPCHSADFKSFDVMEPEKSPGYLGGGNALVSLTGETIYSPNLTPDEDTGIGRWKETDFARALREGFRPDNTPLGYPMLPIPELTDEEITAIYAYLRSIPKISNPVPRVEASQANANVEIHDEGKEIYDRFCRSCHGDQGVGVADLRQVNDHYPSDEALLQWIKNAPAIKPTTRMPRWEGIIKDKEYPVLISYIRKFSQK